ncbi:hypothetical protein A2678_01595 [Candidatus Kaiserbacteria bacterium RIFCSPHIGHO2_01_FULL_53_31]|uniref:Glycosyltransferase subfamily 4-like N-terminal domain-containing protein n=1 Tax=Candidatus Kaiserbacteria bacterium RIFCSPHIGHO2_01_FULL_53_31 TaxID=1798481 RepID=A0A1F6CGE1_9BACT|nr:MAG: hypothetical protein A2678_01595 [Candidatus Kaiserbacteria bacterium RIFCSPHIGHO2_01_FULL_53_31]
MRIVIATPLYPPEIGGPATYAKILAEALPKRGIEVELITFSGVRHLPKIIRHCAYYRRVLRAARVADAVLALDPVSVGLPAMRAAKRAGKPFIVKIVGDYAWEQGRQRYDVAESLDKFVKTNDVPLAVRVLRWVQTRVAATATRVIVPSEYLKKIVAAWSIPSEKIEVIYNAVLLENLGTVPDAVAKLPRPLVVTAGRLVPWKNIGSVIDAAEALSASLAIIGDGPERALLTQQAEEKIPGRFVFTGQLSHADTLATMQSAAVFVLNSSYEGLSHLLIEALALGVPVIATNAGGNSEVIENGVNGMLVPVGDTHALVQALVATHRPRSENGSKFSEEKMVTATVELLNSL